MIERWSTNVESVDALASTGYLEALLAGLRVPVAGPMEIEPATVPERVFATLASRRFGSLNQSRAAAHRRGVIAQGWRAMRRAEPLHFYYDVGGGYHASTQPGTVELSFDVGLAELLVLRQISDFAERVTSFYPLGVRFSLVVDNLCAYLVNDVPVAHTLGYCRRLRQLVRGVGLDSLVDVIVESEHFSVADFAGARADAVAGPDLESLTSKQHENVERFLGRPCGREEAVERTRRYHAVLAVSAELLAPMIRGVHLTQRATASTLGFRPFAGGDAPIECGEVVLTRDGGRTLHPVLLTSTNSEDYKLERHRPDVLPEPIPHVTYARRIDG